MFLIKLKKFIKEGLHIPLNNINKINMKKIIRLNESELVLLIKKIIKEDPYEIAPYKLKTVDGKVEISNTKTRKTLIYSLEAKILGFRTTVYVDSINSETITVSLAGISNTKDLSKDVLNNILKNSFGSKEIKYTTKKGDIVYFVLNS
jgi:hypothetical protein